MSTQRVGRYAIEQQLGAGGMAEVYRARQVGAEGFSRAVALKRVLPNWSRDETFSQMFVAEARISALLAHPNIVSVVDFDRDNEGALFMAMELVDGTDCASLARKAGGALPVSIVAFLIGELLRGLEYAHGFVHEGRALGIVHRDVSPHNVLVSRTGAVKLSDFGIAKATAASANSGMIKGKIAYMAPEQANGEQLDGRADLFAVGVMMYELLVGERPFTGTTEAEILAKVLRAQSVPIRDRAPDVPPDVAQVTMKLLAGDKNKRYANATEALHAILACACYPLDGPGDLSRLVHAILDGGAPPMGLPDRASRSYVASTATAAPTKQTIWTLGAAAFVSATVAVVVWMIPVHKKKPPAAASPAIIGTSSATRSEPTPPTPAPTGVPESAAAVSVPSTTTPASSTPTPTATRPGPHTATASSKAKGYSTVQIGGSSGEEIPIEHP